MTINQLKECLRARLAWYKTASLLRGGVIPPQNGFDFPDGDIPEWQGAIRELQNTLDMLSVLEVSQTSDTSSKHDTVTEMVTFSVNNRLFTLSEQEINAVYDYRLTAHREADALRQLAEYAFGSEEPDEEQLEWFARNYGFLFSEACEHLVGEIVEYYEEHFDCNIDENSTWQNAVRKVLNAHRGGNL